MISLLSKTPLLFESIPYSTFTPPVEQFTPDGSITVFANVFFPSIPFIPATPCSPLSPFAPVNPLQTYFVNVELISLLSKTPLLFKSIPYSILTPPIVQFAPEGSMTVFANVFFPSIPFVPVTPCSPLSPLSPFNPVEPLQTYLVND